METDYLCGDYMGIMKAGTRVGQEIFPGIPGRDILPLKTG